MNSSLYTLFNGFSSLIVGYTGTGNSANGQNNYIQVINNSQTLNITPAGQNNPLTYNFMITEYPCLPFWSPVSSIVFTSIGIPVNPTNTMPTNVYGDTGVSIGSNSTSQDLQMVITDFDLPNDIGTEGRSIVFYSTQGEYRFFDLLGKNLNQLNIGVYWKDKILGNLHQMYLFSGGEATLKLLFRRRDYFIGK
jgi:hypothetical protein